LLEITYGNITASGTTQAGVPSFMIAKTPHLAWAVTSLHSDLSDLWRETLNPEGTSYLLDG